MTFFLFHKVPLLNSNFIVLTIHDFRQKIKENLISQLKQNAGSPCPDFVLSALLILLFCGIIALRKKRTCLLTLAKVLCMMYNDKYQSLLTVLSFQQPDEQEVSYDEESMALIVSGRFETCKTIVVGESDRNVLIEISGVQNVARGENSFHFLAVKE